MPRKQGNVLIGQSGGPTMVINQSLVGLVETCQRERRVGRILGSLRGIQGVLERNYVDLGSESRKTLEAVARTPGSALRSVRKKPTPEECERVYEELKRLDVRWFFYIGGNDSAETANLIARMAQDAHHELVIFHVPKTIDNDLVGTDHCPGYPSAARFVAQALQGDDQDNRSLPGVKIDVIMGRNAGWLTAASAAARAREDDGPHLVYCPERVFDLESFVGDVDRVFTRIGRCVVAVSEGIHDASGKLIGAGSEKDSHGNVQLSGSGALGDLLADTIKRRLGAKLRVRADTFGYLQRSFAGLVSPVDAKEARRVGERAAEVALGGKRASGTISIRRKPRQQYAVSYETAELAQVAKATRRVEERFLAGSNDVTPAFLEWVRPLLGKLPRMGRLSELPLVEG
ncbi:MAG: diphosphate--fructose-6-phosphate 1-phosphotransferase [Planctomycetes bacterium]|nr:diphosphate--fructose-6-phosphate 1-phosphotransferase [Planctomycetota bacterium]